MLLVWNSFTKILKLSGIGSILCLTHTSKINRSGKAEITRTKISAGADVGPPSSVGVGGAKRI